MALNFPSNPITNQEYTFNNTTWRWDGIAWNVVPATTGANAFGVITVPGQQSIVSDNTTDTLNVIAGDNVQITTNPNLDTITISAQLGEPGSTNIFKITSDDSTVVQVRLDDTIQFIGGTGIVTETDPNGNVTINSTIATATFSDLTDANTSSLTVDKFYESAIATLRVDNVGTSAYTFNSHYTGNNPTIFALAGTTIAFDLTAISGLPFEIQNSAGQPYSVGLVHIATNGTISTGEAAQGKSSGTLYWRINELLSGNYRYQCQTFAPMVGAITIKRLSVI